MVRHYIALDMDVAEDSFDVTITPEIGDGIDEEMRSGFLLMCEAGRGHP